MSFYSNYLKKNDLVTLSGTPIWRCNLSLEERESLKAEIHNSSFYSIDERDAAIYYAEWWRTQYSGDTPSKLAVFNSLGDGLSVSMNAEKFYQLARKGAKRLGVKWIRRQHTLYFRSLLLQGGLPLNHIAHNYGAYLRFLLAVVDFQPESVEELEENTEILSYLPTSSRNEIIIENSFEVVTSFLKGEDRYVELFEGNERTRSISQKLKERSQQVERRSRRTRPKINWLLEKKFEPEVTLSLGFGDVYSEQGLSDLLGIQVDERTIQLFVEDKLICTFRKAVSGNYKTDWNPGVEIIWNGEDYPPTAYLVTDGRTVRLTDLIQTIPSTSKPTLWIQNSNGKWRLVKGRTTKSEEAAVLLPIGNKKRHLQELINVGGEEMEWREFEGQIQMTLDEESYQFSCGVSSFDWSISGDRPEWILNSNIPIVARKPNILIYDQSGELKKNGEFSVEIRKKGAHEWKEIAEVVCDLPGMYEARIEFEDVVVEDAFFNIGSCDISIQSSDLLLAELKFSRSYFKVAFPLSNKYECQRKNNGFVLSRHSATESLPQKVPIRFTEEGIGSAYITIQSPFRGLGIVDSSGRMLEENENILIQDLTGYRIATDPRTGPKLTLSNKMNAGVLIEKSIRSEFVPLISLKEEILKVYHLGDVSSGKNTVNLELDSGGSTVGYNLVGYSKFVYVNPDKPSEISVSDLVSDTFQLYAVPIQVQSSFIEAIPLVKKESAFTLPDDALSSIDKYIIIPESGSDDALKTSFWDLSSDQEVVYLSVRIKQFQEELVSGGFEDDAWRCFYEYFKICIRHDLPFSTFDHLQTLPVDPLIAAKAFFFLGYDSAGLFSNDEYLLEIIPRLEKELGFCFHWLPMSAMQEAIGLMCNYVVNQEAIKKMIASGLLSENDLFSNLFKLYNDYLSLNDLDFISEFIQGTVKADYLIGNQELRALRSILGHRVLSELPDKIPRINSGYGFPLDQHRPINLITYSIIAVAESISGIQKDYSIWGFGVRLSLRKNISYVREIVPEFYNQLLRLTLKRITE